MSSASSSLTMFLHYQNHAQTRLHAGGSSTVRSWRRRQRGTGCQATSRASWDRGRSTIRQSMPVFLMTVIRWMLCRVCVSADVFCSRVGICGLYLIPLLVSACVSVCVCVCVCVRLTAVIADVAQGSSGLQQHLLLLRAEQLHQRRNQTSLHTHTTHEFYRGRERDGQ